MRHLWQDEKLLSVVVTFIVHALLVGLFFLIHIDFTPVQSEFVELGFTAGWGIGAPEPSVSSIQAGGGASVSENLPLSPEKPMPSEMVRLPERRDIPFDEEQITEQLRPEEGKMFVQHSPRKRLRISAPPISLKEPSATIPFRKKEKGMPGFLFHKENPVAPLEGTQKITQNIQKEFEIDWQGDIQREIYQKRLPEFPPDVQREAVIKIKFTVLPNGLIGSAVLLQKGDTRLENLTLEAFKTWRFNPLPPYVDQVPQQGVITFYFKLK